MNKTVDKDVQSKIELVAEQWVRLVMEHIRWKRSDKNKKE